VDQPQLAVKKKKNSGQVKEYTRQYTNAIHDPLYTHDAALENSEPHDYPNVTRPTDGLY
jgi:hypothetical protein